jgi:hypothetical protein
MSAKRATSTKEKDARGSSAGKGRALTGNSSRASADDLGLSEALAIVRQRAKLQARREAEASRAGGTQRKKAPRGSAPGAVAGSKPSVATRSPIPRASKGAAATTRGTSSPAASAPRPSTSRSPGLNAAKATTAKATTAKASTAKAATAKASTAKAATAKAATAKAAAAKATTAKATAAKATTAKASTAKGVPARVPAAKVTPAKGHVAMAATAKATARPAPTKPAAKLAGTKPAPAAVAAPAKASATAAKSIEARGHAVGSGAQILKVREAAKPAPDAGSRGSRAKTGEGPALIARQKNATPKPTGPKAQKGRETDAAGAGRTPATGEKMKRETASSAKKTSGTPSVVRVAAGQRKKKELPPEPTHEAPASPAASAAGQVAPASADRSGEDKVIRRPAKVVELNPRLESSRGIVPKVEPQPGSRPMSVAERQRAEAEAAFQKIAPALAASSVPPAVAEERPTNPAFHKSQFELRTSERDGMMTALRLSQDRGQSLELAREFAKRYRELPSDQGLLLKVIELGEDKLTHLALDGLLELDDRGRVRANDDIVRAIRGIDSQDRVIRELQELFLEKLGAKRS